MPNAYQLMEYCPRCGTKLEMVETPIDDVKDCPVSMDHTVFLNDLYSRREDENNSYEVIEKEMI